MKLRKTVLSLTLASRKPLLDYELRCFLWFCCAGLASRLTKNSKHFLLPFLTCTRKPHYTHTIFYTHVCSLTRKRTLHYYIEHRLFFLLLLHLKTHPLSHLWWWWWMVVVHGKRVIVKCCASTRSISSLCQFSCDLAVVGSIRITRISLVSLYNFFAWVLSQEKKKTSTLFLLALFKSCEKILTSPNPQENQIFCDRFNSSEYFFSKGENFQKILLIEWKRYHSVNHKLLLSAPKNIFIEIITINCSKK